MNKNKEGSSHYLTVGVLQRKLPGSPLFACLAAKGGKKEPHKREFSLHNKEGLHARYYGHADIFRQQAYRLKARK